MSNRRLKKRVSKLHLLTNYPRRPQLIQEIKGSRRAKHIILTMYTSALAISSLRSGKNLPDPYKDHPIHQGLIEEEEAPIIVEQDSSEEEE